MQRIAVGLLVCWMTMMGAVENVSAQQPGPMQRASTLIGNKQFGQAENILRIHVKQNPQAYQAWYLLGYAQQALGKREEAIRSYDQAAKGPQVKAVAVYNKAAVLAQQGKLEAALATLRKAFEAGFKNVDRLENDNRLKNLRPQESFLAFLKEQREHEKLFVEDARVIHRWLGEAAGDEFGWIARLVGDLDGDGVTDFVATAPSRAAGNGQIYVYSAKSGELLFEVAGRAGERLGNGAAGAGDVNQDGIPDIVVGAPNHRDGGNVYVFSGSGGEKLLEWKSPKAQAKFGYKVASVGDCDGDGHDDIIATAIAGDGQVAGSGVAIAYSGKTGDRLFVLKGERSGDKFGSAVSATRQGTTPLLAIGAQDAGPNQRGRVYVYRLSGSQPELAFTIEGDSKSVNLGMMFVSFPGDANGDGVSDVYASDFSDRTSAPGAGKIVVHDGKSGKQLYSITGTKPGEGFGTSPSEAGDVNGDGVGDLIIGAWQHATGALSGGRVSLHDGSNGRELDAWTCNQRGDTFGFDAVGIGDVDGDGNVDFLLTSGWANIHGPKTGRVFIVAGKNYGPNE